MNLIDDIKKIELEITSNCNASCPGCARTLRQGDYEIADVTIEDIMTMFPTKESMFDKQFKFCGVLGDPIVNKDCLDIVSYLTGNGGYCQLSTNAGLRSKEWWETLGTISKATGMVDVNFCIDGHEETNHIYRIGTIWSNIERNLEAFCSAPGEGAVQATWIYIVFDHNEHELEKAKAHAERLGIPFATRTGMRNSFNDWVAQIKKRNQETRQVTQEVKKITTTGIKAHSKVEQVKELQQFIDQSKVIKQQATTEQKEISQEYLDKKREIMSSIKCKMVHEEEIFLASNMTLWPCCFVWDSYFKNKDNIKSVFKKYDSDWNDLRKHSIDEILAHPWFAETLGLSWDPDHPQHIDRCIRTCAYNKAYQNEIKIL